MKRKSQGFVIIFVLFLAKIGHSQITYQKKYGGWSGEEATALIKTIDGGFIIAGFTGSFGAAGYADCYVIKTNFYGDTLWTRTYGTIERDYPYSVLQTNDGGYVFAGMIQNNSTTHSVIYVMKTDSTGNIYWSKTYLVGGSNSSWAKTILKASDGGYIIGGSTHFSAGYEDAYLLKIDTSGSVAWAKTYGGIYFDGGYSFQTTIDGGYIIVGYTGNFGAGSNDVYVIKTDTTGNMQWSKTYGGANQDIGLSVQQTLDSGYVIAGYTQSFGAGNRDMYLIKTNISGDIQWSKTYGGPSSDIAQFVEQTNDGGYIIAGSHVGSATASGTDCIVKINSIGDTIWTRIIGDSTSCISVHQTNDGGFVIGGSRFFSSIDSDIYLAKTDSGGITGCNENIPSIIITSPSTQTTNAATIVNNSFASATNSPFNTGNGGIITTYCFGVGINEQLADENSIIIYPNPAKENLFIRNNAEMKSMNIQICNLYGEIIFEQSNFKSLEVRISLINISSGVYFVKVFAGEKYCCKKLIIE